MKLSQRLAIDTARRGFVVPARSGKQQFLTRPKLIACLVVFPAEYRVCLKSISTEKGGEHIDALSRSRDARE